MAKKDKILESIDSLFDETGMTTAELYDLLEEEPRGRPVSRAAVGSKDLNEQRSREELIKSRLEKRERDAADRINKRKAAAKTGAQTNALAIREKGSNALVKYTGKTAGKTAAKAAAKRGILSLLARGAGAMAGGPVGIGLLGLSLLPMLISGDRMSKAEREKTIKKILLEQKMQGIAGRQSGIGGNRIADSIYNRDLDRGLKEATAPKGGMTPELAKLLGGEQGRLQSLNESLGGSQRINLEQALQGMGRTRR
tara:strand:- start:110 stop:871 length:762 start_codon:yes stop_codon:yes gene_type:complete